MHESVSEPAPRRLAQSWVHNAAAWTQAVQTGGIPSRRAGTDAAILGAAARLPLGRVLDVGCGEGWLARALAEAGHIVTGVDASEPLIEAARRAGGAAGDTAGRLRFEVATYANLRESMELPGAPFTAAICNFALLDDDATAALAAVHRVLVPGATLLIQTVHPFTAHADGVYEDGWREEDFAAFGQRFPSTMPWFYRTMSSWIRSVLAAGFAVTRLEEPRAADQPLPLSLLITATRH